MNTFRDNKGRQWTCRVDYAALRRVRDTLGINLADTAVNDKGENVILTRIASDPVLLVDVLFLVCCFRDGASTVTDDDFAESIVGDVIDDASLALLTGIAEFFPTSRRLPMLKAVEMTRAAMKEYRESMTATLTGESPE